MSHSRVIYDKYTRDFYLERAESEGDIQSAILELLSWHPMVSFAKRRNVGGMFRGGRYIRFGEKGDSDIYGMLKGGTYFEIEVKQKGRKPTDEQMDNILITRAHGGVAGVAYTVEDAKNIIEGAKPV